MEMQVHAVVVQMELVLALVLVRAMPFQEEVFLLVV
jgi:hypothetical protein